MIRISKYISGFFLCLAGLAFSAHMIIPHDHHLADINSLTDYKCPASENNTSHNNGSPIHCCSLNDLTSEKAARFLITEHLKLSIPGPGNTLVSSVLYPKEYFILLFENPELFIGSNLIESSPLRAPPSFC